MGSKIEIGEIQNSINFGQYEVIELIDSKYAKVKFITTGYETTISRSEVRRGQVKDWSYSGKNSIGEAFDTNNCGKAIVLEYINYNNVLVQFIDTKNIITCSFSNLSQGLIYDVLAKNVGNSTGFIGIGAYSPTKHKVWYHKWASMLLRCYDPNDENYCRYGATGISVCSEWHNFQNFAKWCELRSDYQSGWELDKDILLKGNKQYHPHKCCFVPARINSLIIKSDNVSGRWSEKDNRWYFSYRDANSKKIHKSFIKQEEGQSWYAENKERVIKELAEIYKCTIDKQTYNSLVSWNVSTGD